MGRFMQNKFVKKVVSFISLSAILSSAMGLGGMMPGSKLTTEAADFIPISTAEELLKIGRQSSYPLTGDYKLTADIDLSEIDFTPIGGTVGKRGSVSGSNVFSGTFDGDGHLISNLTIQVSETISSDAAAMVGLFSNVASNNSSDYAEVKNIVFANAYVKADITNGFTSAGIVAGDVNGYARIGNIAVLSGDLIVNPGNTSDVVGAGGIIGEIRTDGGITNNQITVSNVYNAAMVNVGSSTGMNYAGGIIGRIAYTNCQSVTNCVNVGQTYFKGDLGAGISNFSSGAASSCLTNSYFLFDTGQPSASGTTELSEEEMKTAVLLNGLDSSKWYASEGMYPLLKICQNPGSAGYLVLSAISPVFAEGEDASKVSSNFTLPLTVGGVGITWTSNNSVITINGANANVSGVFSDTKVVLTASTADGLSRKFMVTVVSNIKAQFDQNYAKPETPLKASVANAPSDMALTYSWKIGGKAISNSTNTYTPTSGDLEKFITLTITSTNYPASWNLTMYCSELPVVYIDTVDGASITSNTTYKNANFKLQGNDEFSNSATYYDGVTEIRGRGNSTWSFALGNGLKKPYKIKLNKKTDLLGMGRNKHWVLLANVIDHTNMRNQLMYEFSNDIGMEYYMKSTNVILILNGTYEGIYQLAEQKRIAETRVNIFEWDGLAENIAGAIAAREGLNSVLSSFEEKMKTDYSWYSTGQVTFQGRTYNIRDYYTGEIPEFTGGFLLDMDFRLNDSKYISKFWTTYSQPIHIDFPEYAKTSDEMMNFTKNYVQSFENALHSDDFYTMYNGEKVHYSDLFDIQSLVQNWLVVEYSMDWDGMKNSTPMYKDLEGKMKMGPVWDFDWCWGNINMYSMAQTWKIEGWHTTEQSFMEQRPQQEEQWNRYLAKDPYFAVLAYELWQEARPTYIEDMIKTGGKIDQLQTKYKTASEANDAKWSSTYYKYSGYGLTNGTIQYKNSELYADAITTMKYFLKKRVEWFDTKFTSPDDILKSWGLYVGSNQISVSNIDTVSQSKAAEFTVSVASASQEAVTKIGFYVNGIEAGIANVSNGTAKLTVPDSALRSEEGVDNVVQIRALNSSGGFVKSGSNVITNYARFQKAVAAELSGIITIQGGTTVGSKLEAVLTDSNNTGSLAYQWFADDVEISGAVGRSYTLTANDIGKRISVVIISNEESGSLQSSKTNAVSDIVDTNDHIVINQVYGGGGKSDTPLSNNFIELYNPTDSEIDLSGYEIGYMSSRGGSNAGNTNGTIIKKALTGTLPARTSYLILCAPETPNTKHFTIDAFDLDWTDQTIDNKQFQVILYQNSAIVDAVSVDEASVEGTPIAGITKQLSIRRIDFSDTNDNSVDFEKIDYQALAGKGDNAGYEAVRPRSTANGTQGGLINDILINQVYGGGGKGTTPLSHSFIELYNPTDSAIDLSGYEIGYMSSRSGDNAGTTNGTVIKKSLAGTLPARTSYLILCAPETPAAKYFTIDAFDLDWTDQTIDNKQFQVILYENSTIVDAVSVDEASVEGTPIAGITKQLSIRRIDFSDTKDNSVDFEKIDYQALAGNGDNAGYEAIRPRSKADGAWPVLTGTLTIQGEALTGAVLTAILYGSNNSGIISYQWLANGQEIPGAVSKTYTLTSGELGKTITVSVTSSVEPGMLTSSATAAIQDSGNFTATVTIEGVAAVGQALTAKIADSNHTGTLRYQWSANNTDITGANASTYRLTANELEKTITVTVSSTKEIGTVSSSPTMAVVNTLSGDVTIQGETVVGQTLTASVTNTNNTGNLLYQWKANNIEIEGATASAYLLTDYEIRKTITVSVSSSKEYGSITSSSTSAVTALPLTGNVIIKGEAIQGETLTAEVTDSNHSGDLLYQWYANNAMINRATASTYQLTENEIGKTITVTVSCAAKTGTLTSEPTSVVLRLLTGTVTIQGEAVVGNTLTVDITGSNYTGTLNYQWKADGIDLNGATSHYYQLTDKEIGKTITITISSQNEGGSITSAPTSAVAQVMPTSIRLSSSNLSIKKGTSAVLKSTILPANASGTSLTWSSSNNKVATVSKELNSAGKETGNAKITAKGKGTATITVKTPNGKTAACKITVGQVKLNVTSAKMQVKQTTKVFVVKSKYPENDKVAKWTSSKPSIASVSKTGKVKAKKTGTTVLTVTMKSKATASIRLTVTNSVVHTKKLKADKTKLSLKKGGKYTLKITRNPVTANDKLTYTSSASNIASVNSSGTIRAISKGTATIKVKSASGKEASVKVTVK